MPWQAQFQLSGNAAELYERYSDRYFMASWARELVQLAALREMRRTLVPGGRVFLSVWKAPGPYNFAAGAALERHVGAEAAVRYRASRAELQPYADGDGVAVPDEVSIAIARA